MEGVRGCHGYLVYKAIRVFTKGPSLSKFFSNQGLLNRSSFLTTPQLLDYGEITEREATVIGRKGKRSSPPQFKLPTSVAVDRLGRIYVADYGNGRIQILDASGKMAREPLNIGGKCRPCALAVSAHGDLVMTDSQIIRVFSRTGWFHLSSADIAQ